MGFLDFEKELSSRVVVIARFLLMHEAEPTLGQADYLIQGNLQGQFSIAEMERNA